MSDVSKFIGLNTAAELVQEERCFSDRGKKKGSEIHFGNCLLLRSDIFLSDPAFPVSSTPILSSILRYVEGKKVSCSFKLLQSLIKT